MDKDQPRRRFSLVLVIAAAILFRAAAEGAAATEPPAQIVPVTLNAGETYVITGVDASKTPAVRVISNPKALIVRSDGKSQLALLGAGPGEWALDVTNSDGRPLSYEVKVSANTSGGPAPVALTDASVDRSAPARSAPGNQGNKLALTTPLDPGAGPETVLTPSDAAPAPPPASGSVQLNADELSPPSPHPAPTLVAPTFPTQAASAAAQPPLERFHSDPLAAPSAQIAAAPGGANYLTAEQVTLMTGTSRIFDFVHRLRRVSVADTEVADLQVVTPYQLNLIGHQKGFTTLAIWDNQGHYEEHEVRVDPVGKQQVLLNCIVAELDRDRMESQAINWTGVLNNYNVSLVGLGAGGVATPYSPNDTLSNSYIIPGVAGAAPTQLTTTAQGTVPAGGQIIPLLLSQSLNYGLSWGNSVGQAQAFFNFLETHSLAKVLAEPHLLANSGEKAEFLSGGEIPIVIAQALNTSIEFKQFGTSVTFLPTVVGGDEIEMAVKPEVSQPDYVHGVQEFGFNIPAFVTRRADTFVRIKNNQTLIIAGLLLHTKTSEVDKTPYLGDLPYVGSLFRHTTYSDQNTDLVMSVTPQIVQALPANGRVATPVERGPLSDEEIRTDRLAQPDASRPRF